jgi:hypothetical protein
VLRKEGSGGRGKEWREGDALRKCDKRRRKEGKREGREMHRGNTTARRAQEVKCDKRS